MCLQNEAEFLFLSSTSTLISILIRRKSCFAEVSKRITLHADRRRIGIEIVGTHSTWRARYSQHKRKKVLIASTVQHAKGTHVFNMASSKRRGIVYVLIHIAHRRLHFDNILRTISVSSDVT